MYLAIGDIVSQIPVGSPKEALLHRFLPGLTAQHCVAKADTWLSILEKRMRFSKSRVTFLEGSSGALALRVVAAAQAGRMEEAEAARRKLEGMAQEVAAMPAGECEVGGDELLCASAAGGQAQQGVPIHAQGADAIVALCSVTCRPSPAHYSGPLASSLRLLAFPAAAIWPGWVPVVPGLSGAAAWARGRGVGAVSRRHGSNPVGGRADGRTGGGGRRSGGRQRRSGGERCSF